VRSSAAGQGVWDRVEEGSVSMAAGHGCLAEFRGTEASLFLHRILVILATIVIMSSAWVASSRADSVILTWTAPGEDSLLGPAFRYDLRCSAQMITPQNFLLATEAPAMPLPAIPGTLQFYFFDGLESGTTYYFAIKTSDQAGNWSAMSNVIVRVAQGMVQAPAAPARTTPGISFSAPWPNPARDVAHFAWVLPALAELSVQVFDLSGRRVRVLLEGSHVTGPGGLAWDLRDDRGMPLPGGIYLVSARLGEVGFFRRVAIAR